VNIIGCIGVILTEAVLQAEGRISYRIGTIHASFLARLKNAGHRDDAVKRK
jgi:hypothetical protein